MKVMTDAADRFLKEGLPGSRGRGWSGCIQQRSNKRMEMIFSGNNTTASQVPV